jgi:hypothetical protein
MNRLITGALCVTVGGLLTVAAGAADAAVTGDSTTAANETTAAHEVPGLTGAAALQAVGNAADRFRALTAARISLLTGTRAAKPALAAEEIHDAWGTYFVDSAGKGLTATHSVQTITVHGGDVIYAPTALPPGGACTEITTAYTDGGAVLWAWDWCGGRDTIGKVVNLDSAFIAKYTTTVNGLPSYTMRETQTSTSNNAWTVYLYNYSTSAWDTFYATSGTKDIPAVSWDFFEIYSVDNPSTGVGYFCGDGAGKSFEASSIQVGKNDTWVAADDTNSDLGTPPAGSTFNCPSLTFTPVNQNDHWIAKIG